MKGSQAGEIKRLKLRISQRELKGKTKTSMNMIIGVRISQRELKESYNEEHDCRIHGNLTKRIERMFILGVSQIGASRISQRELKALSAITNILQSVGESHKEN